MKPIRLLILFSIFASESHAEPPTIEDLTRRVEALERFVEEMKFAIEASKRELELTVNNDDNDKRGDIIINLFKDGSIRVEGEEVNDEELSARLEPILKNSPNQTIIIRAAGEVKYQEVVRIIDLCQRLGGWNISFATLKP